MKQLILITLLNLLIGSVFSQDQMSFDDLKTGKFTYEGNEGEIEIIRTKKKQIEIFNDGKSKLILKIKWINDSTYVLTHIKAKNAVGCLQKGDTIKAIILNRNGNRYECSYSSIRCGDGQSVFIKLE